MCYSVFKTHYCVFKSLLCINMSKSALSLFDDAKLGTKKMRSNLLKRIQKQKQKVCAENRKIMG